MHKRLEKLGFYSNCEFSENQICRHGNRWTQIFEFFWKTAISLMKILDPPLGTPTDFSTKWRLRAKQSRNKSKCNLKIIRFQRFYKIRVAYFNRGGICVDGSYFDKNFGRGGIEARTRYDRKDHRGNRSFIPKAFPDSSEKIKRRTKSQMRPIGGIDNASQALNSYKNFIRRLQKHYEAKLCTGKVHNFVSVYSWST